ncbi:MAG: sulfurtransferase [Blastocatellia bacterium]|nr:sulfurtransferase [Blastocatellia bacterium]
MKRLILLLMTSLLLAVAGPAQSKTKPVTRTQMLVTTDWLAKNLNNPNVIVIQVGREQKDYVAGHLPNARFLPLNALVITRNKNANELPPVDKLKTLFANLGINNDSRVVLYGDNYNLLAARAYYTLDYLGFGDKAALLDGGLDKWKAEKRQLSTEIFEVKPGNFTPRVNPNVIAVRDVVRDVSWVTANLDAPNYALIDARPNDEYTGAKADASLAKLGHIPGAVSIFWMDKNLVSKENPVLKTPQELRQIYEAAGATQGKKVVSYCRTGVQASHTYFVAKYLGYEVAMYDGSFSEWVTLEGAPVITGDKVK